MLMVMFGHEREEMAYEKVKQPRYRPGVAQRIPGN
jgi:hypothetical protein